MVHIEILQMEMTLWDGEAVLIRSHIESCTSCRMTYGALKQFYTYLDEFLRSEPTERDLLEANKILALRE